MNTKLLISLFLVILLVFSSIHLADRISSTQLDKAFTRSVTVFAIARGLNGLISVVQGTEVYATPAGVGVNFAVGQIVDPINDMVERFSWIMLMSSVSLGIQEIMLGIGETQAVQWLFNISVLFVLIMLWIPQLWNVKVFNLLFKSLVVFTFLRFVIPLLVLFNEGLFTYVLEPRYEEAKSALEYTQKEAEVIVHQVQKNEKNRDSSWLDSINVSKQVQDFKVKTQALWDSLKNKFDHAIAYMLTLITIFIIQSVLIPIVALWLFLNLFRKFWDMDLTGEIFKEKSV